MLRFYSNLNITKTILLIKVISLLAVIFSYCAEIIFKILPCILCLYQRYIYILITAIAYLSQFKIPSIKVSLKAILIIITILLMGEIVIASYNIGVERNIFTGLKSCKVNHYNYSNTDELLLYFKTSQKLAPCTGNSNKLYGFTFAEMNLALSTLLFILSLHQLFKDKNDKT